MRRVLPHARDQYEGLKFRSTGLIPFWTKRNPDYGSVMKTINARDDSLVANGGMWNTMKRGKRCVVVAQGFYEWLKKNGGKEKIPHYTKRKDGQLMCFAGLWDCVQYEGRVAPHNHEFSLCTGDIVLTLSQAQRKRTIHILSSQRTRISNFHSCMTVCR